MTRKCAALVSCLAVCVAACGKTSAIPGSPTAVSCALAISPMSQDVPQAGGSFHASVNGSCAWSTTTDADWIVVTHGQGSDIGTITYDVVPNTGSARRQGRLRLGEQSLVVSQAGVGLVSPPVPPTPTPDPPSPNPPSPGPPAPAPTPAPAPPAPAPPAPASPVPAPPAPAPAPAPPPPEPAPPAPGPESPGPTPPGESECTYALTASSARVPSGGGSLTLNVSTGADCPWSSSSSDAWIRAASGPRAGTGSVAVTVSVNTGGPRTGRIVAGSASVTIAQDGAAPAPCTFTLAAPRNPVPAHAGDFKLDVFTDAHCRWSASSTAEWIGASTMSMTGSGSVSFAVRPNTGDPREGVITVDKTSVVIRQEGCVTGVEPAVQKLPSGAGGGKVGVTASDACTWSVRAPAWILGLPDSGKGAGGFGFRVESNPGQDRSGTIEIGGRKVDVTQAGFFHDGVVGR